VGNDGIIALIRGRGADRSAGLAAKCGVNCRVNGGIAGRVVCAWTQTVILCHRQFVCFVLSLNAQRTIERRKYVFSGGTCSPRECPVRT
jgi:hypothetical protein